MARHKPAAEPLPRIWNVPDDLWFDFIEPILRRHDPEPRIGRPRIDQRKALVVAATIARRSRRRRA
jgi:hypothetical protein